MAGTWAVLHWLSHVAYTLHTLGHHARAGMTATGPSPGPEVHVQVVSESGQDERLQKMLSSKVGTEEMEAAGTGVIWGYLGISGGGHDTRPQPKPKPQPRLQPQPRPKPKAKLKPSHTHLSTAQPTPSPPLPSPSPPLPRP